MLIEQCLGKRMVILSDINNMAFLVGICMTYVFTISKFFLELYSVFFNTHPGNAVKIIQMIVCMFLFQIPLSLLKDISKLQYASMAGSVTLIYTIIIIVVQIPPYYQEGIDAGRSVVYFESLDLKWLESFSIFFYGFAAHNGLFAIFTGLSKPSYRRSLKVLNGAMALLVVMFGIIAFSGFFYLLKETPSIFVSRVALISYIQNNQVDWMPMVSKILFFFSLNCLCAINYNILRQSLKSFFFNQQNLPTFWEVTICVCVYIFANVVAFFVNDVVSIIGILGAVCAVIVCYVCPILCYVVANDYSKYHWKNIGSVFILLIVIVLGFCSFVQQIYKYFDHQ